MSSFGEDYNLDEAAKFIGKRVIVSLRHIENDGSESYSGLWGVIDSAHENGLLLKIEGGIDEEYWMLPPDLEALQPAQHEFYEFNEKIVIQNVDYEAYFSTASSIEDLENRS